MLLSVLAVLLMSCSQHEVGGHTAEMVFADPQVRALADAACEGDAVEVKRLVGQGVSVNARGDKKFTPLLWALTCRNEAGMKALLDAGADPNQAADDDPPVLVAATYDDPKFLKLLLAQGGNVNAEETKSVRTALITAFSVGLHRDDWRNYYILLNAGADINREHMDGTIADWAVSMGRMDKVIELLERGYTHDLNDLALGTYITQIGDSFPKIKQDQKRLLALLKVKGVPVDAIIAKRKADDAQHEREQKAYQDSLINPKPASTGTQ